MIRCIVIADHKTVDRQSVRKARVNLLDNVTGDGASRDIGLIGHDNQQEARTLQSLERAGNSGKNFQGIYRCRRARFTVADRRTVNHAVSIEKYRPPARARRFHFREQAIPTWSG